MMRSQFRFTAGLLFSILVFSVFCYAAENPKEVLTISDSTLSPEKIVLAHRDGSVFILNDSKSNEYRIEIPWKDRRLHCASKNLKFSEEKGAIESTGPLKPGDFVIACFPDVGEYEVKVNKWKGSKPMRAVINVSPAE